MSRAGCMRLLERLTKGLQRLSLSPHIWLGFQHSTTAFNLRLDDDSERHFRKELRRHQTPCSEQCGRGELLPCKKIRLVVASSPP